MRINIMHSFCNQVVDRGELAVGEMVDCVLKKLRHVLLKLHKRGLLRKYNVRGFLCEKPIAQLTTFCRFYCFNYGINERKTFMMHALYADGLVFQRVEKRGDGWPDTGCIAFFQRIPEARAFRSLRRPFPLHHALFDKRSPLHLGNPLVASCAVLPDRGAEMERLPSLPKPSPMRTG